jgi:5-methylcytosine-specific restriction protein A
MESLRWYQCRGTLMIRRSLREGTFAPAELTMDHKVPLARGGCSTKGNVVPCCKACNATKRYWTPAELVLQQLKAQESTEQ